MENKLDKQIFFYNLFRSFFRKENETISCYITQYKKTRKRKYSDLLKNIIGVKEIGGISYLSIFDYFEVKFNQYPLPDHSFDFKKGEIKTLFYETFDIMANGRKQEILDLEIEIKKCVNIK